MSENVECQIFPINKTSYHPVIQIERAANPGIIETHLIVKKSMFTFNMGDKIQCVQGHVFIQIRPGNQTRGFHLKEPFTTKDGVRGDMLEINEETIKPVSRGPVFVGPDIGNRNKGSVIVR